jgi:pimeloyl-ACP methyl ester carboxylesterase
MRETAISVAGLSVRALEAGEGPLILYLHGLDGPRFDPLALALSKSHRVLLPEIPGFGRAPLPEWMTSIADAALFGLDLVEAIGGAPLHVVGHSLGGWIALEMAIRDPRAFATMTLVSAMGVQAGDPGFDPFAGSADEAVRAQFHDQAKAQAEITARAGEDIDVLLQNRTGLARLGWTPRFADLQLPWWLHRVRAKTLIFHGEADRYVPLACADVLARDIANAELVRFANCGHALPWERGDEAAAKIGKFIAGARR